MSWDSYVHGLWVLGTVLIFLGALIAGNVEWVEGTTQASFAVSVLISGLLILFGGVCWISSAANSKREVR